MNDKPALIEHFQKIRLNLLRNQTNCPANCKLQSKNQNWFPGQSWRISQRESYRISGWREPVFTKRNAFGYIFLASLSLLNIKLFLILRIKISSERYRQESKIAWKPLSDSGSPLQDPNRLARTLRMFNPPVPSATRRNGINSTDLGALGSTDLSHRIRTRIGRLQVLSSGLITKKLLSKKFLVPIKMLPLSQ